MPGKIYLLTSSLFKKLEINRFKIGKHLGDYENLIKRYKTYIPDVKIIHFIEVGDADQIEQEILLRLDQYRIPHEKCTKYNSDDPISKCNSKSEWLECNLEIINLTLSSLLGNINQISEGKLLEYHDMDEFVSQWINQEICYNKKFPVLEVGKEYTPNYIAEVYHCWRDFTGFECLDKCSTLRIFEERITCRTIPFEICKKEGIISYIYHKK